MMTITTIVLLRFAVFVAGHQQFCGWFSNISSRPAGYEAHKFFCRHRSSCFQSLSSCRERDYGSKGMPTDNNVVSEHLYRQDYRVAANCRYCFYAQAKNHVFRLAGTTSCTDSGQTFQNRRAPRSTWMCKISRQSVQIGENAAPKYKKKLHFLIKSIGATPLTDFRNC